RRQMADRAPAHVGVRRWRYELRSRRSIRQEQQGDGSIQDRERPVSADAPLEPVGRRQIWARGRARQGRTHMLATTARERENQRKRESPTSHLSEPYRRSRNNPASERKIPRSRAAE